VGGTVGVLLNLLTSSIGARRAGRIERASVATETGESLTSLEPDANNEAAISAIKQIKTGLTDLKTPQSGLEFSNKKVRQSLANGIGALERRRQVEQQGGDTSGLDRMVEATRSGLRAIQAKEGASEVDKTEAGEVLQFIDQVTELDVKRAAGLSAEEQTEGTDTGNITSVIDQEISAEGIRSLTPEQQAQIDNFTNKLRQTAEGKGRGEKFRDVRDLEDLQQQVVGDEDLTTQPADTGQTIEQSELSELAELGFGEEAIAAEQVRRADDALNTEEDLAVTQLEGTADYEIETDTAEDTGPAADTTRATEIQGTGATDTVDTVGSELRSTATDLGQTSNSDVSTDTVTRNGKKATPKQAPQTVSATGSILTKTKKEKQTSVGGFSLGMKVTVGTRADPSVLEDIGEIVEITNGLVKVKLSSRQNPITIARARMQEINVEAARAAQEADPSSSVADIIAASREPEVPSASKMQAAQEENGLIAAGVDILDATDGSAQDPAILAIKQEEQVAAAKAQTLTQLEQEELRDLNREKERLTVDLQILKGDPLASDEEIQDIRDLLSGVNTQIRSIKPGATTKSSPKSVKYRDEVPDIDIEHEDGELRFSTWRPSNEVFIPDTDTDKQAAVNFVKSKLRPEFLGKKLEIVYAPEGSDLEPQSVKDFKISNSGSGKSVRGLFRTGRDGSPDTIILFGAGLRTSQQTISTLMHEMVGHYGLRQFFNFIPDSNGKTDPEGYNKLLQRVLDNNNEMQQDILKKITSWTSYLDRWHAKPGNDINKLKKGEFIDWINPNFESDNKMARLSGTIPKALASGTVRIPREVALELADEYLADLARDKMLSRDFTTNQIGKDPKRAQLTRERGKWLERFLDSVRHSLRRVFGTFSNSITNEDLENAVAASANNLFRNTNLDFSLFSQHRNSVMAKQIIPENPVAKKLPNRSARPTLSLKRTTEVFSVEQTVNSKSAAEITGLRGHFNNIDNTMKALSNVSEARRVDDVLDVLASGKLSAHENQVLSAALNEVLQREGTAFTMSDLLTSVNQQHLPITRVTRELGQSERSIIDALGYADLPATETSLNLQDDAESQLGTAWSFVRTNLTHITNLIANSAGGKIGPQTEARLIRELVRDALDQGKTAIRFPTQETAEKLGVFVDDYNKTIAFLKKEYFADGGLNVKEDNFDNSWIEVRLEEIPFRPINEAQADADAESIAAAEAVRQGVPLEDISEVNKLLQQDFGKLVESTSTKRYNNFVKGMRKNPVLEKFFALGNLPSIDMFQGIEAVGKGRISKLEDKTKTLSKIIQPMNNLQRSEIYTYFTNRDADVNDLPVTLPIKNILSAAKQEIQDLGKYFADNGLINPESFEENKGQYLFTIYMQYLNTNRGGGKQTSFMDWAKKRKDLPEEVRLGLGEFKDPEFLIAETLGVMGRDSIILEMLQNIRDASVENDLFWVLDDEQFVKFEGKKVSISELEKRIDQNNFSINFTLEENAGIFNPKNETLLALQESTSRMEVALEEGRAEMKRQVKESIAPAALSSAQASGAVSEEVDVDTFIADHYTKMKEGKRYGKLSGKLVRNEIFNDLNDQLNAYQVDKSDPIISFFSPGGALDKSHQYWKWMKVPGNLPSWPRNATSNFALLDVSTKTNKIKLMDWVYQEFRAVLKNEQTEFGKITKEHGGMGTTYSNNELNLISNRFLDKMKLAEEASKDSNKRSPIKKALIMFEERLSPLIEISSEYFGILEGIFKTVAVKDFILDWQSQEDGRNYKDLGAAEQKVLFINAMQAANDAILDYSSVPPFVKFMRRYPLGSPFLTFTYKVFPVMVKAAMTNPIKFAEYAAMPALISMVAMATISDWKDEDMTSLKNQLPDFYRDNPSVTFLPFRNDAGQPQFMTLDYAIPWSPYSSSMMNIINHWEGNSVAGNTLSSMKALRESLLDAGFLGGYLPQVISGLLSNRDGFTGQDIMAENASPERQIMQFMSYSWNLAAPSWLGSHGFLGKLNKSFNGEKDRLGNVKVTPDQVLTSIAGFSTRSFTPESNLANIRRQFQAEERGLNKEKFRILGDVNLGPSAKASQLKELNIRLKLLFQRRQKRLG